MLIVYLCIHQNVVFLFVCRISSSDNVVTFIWHKHTHSSQITSFLSICGVCWTLLLTVICADSSLLRQELFHASSNWCGIMVKKLIAMQWKIGLKYHNWESWIVNGRTISMDNKCIMWIVSYQFIFYEKFTSSKLWLTTTEMIIRVLFLHSTRPKNADSSIHMLDIAKNDDVLIICPGWKLLIACL